MTFAQENRVEFPSRRRSASDAGALAVVSRWLGNLVFVGLSVYLTYFFTQFFANRPPTTTASLTPESARAEARKNEELRALERDRLSTYAPEDPATHAVRLPIDRAMELLVAEGGKLASPFAALATAPVAAPGSAPGSSPAAPGTAAAAPVASGLSPEQMYRAVCIACHDVDGRGKIVRLAMPTIPDLTDPKWQSSRTDAELIHSILEGKGQFMLPMKDKLALAHTDVMEMMRFMRSFAGGKKVLTPGGAPAVGLTPAGPTAGVPAASLSTAVVPSAGAATPLAPADGLQPLGPAATTTLSSPARPASLAADPRARAGQAIFNVNCIPCHGVDGRGTAVRMAMPPIPDFTSADWHKSKQNAQLAFSILEGKGTLMPPWRGKVTPEQAQDLVAYIRTFAPPGVLLAQQASAGDFQNKFQKLRQEWDALDQQAHALVPR